MVGPGREHRRRYKGKVGYAYVTYGFGNSTRVKRVAVPGAVVNGRVGYFRNRMGRRVYGVRINYRQEREAYRRSTGARVAPTTLVLAKVVEVPSNARDVAFHETLPPRFRNGKRTA